MDKTNDSERIKTMIDDVEPQLIADRRDFHAYPESCWTEFRTSALIAARLIGLGFDTRIGADAVLRESMTGLPTDSELENGMARAKTEGADSALVDQMKGGLTGVVADLRGGPGPICAIRFDIDALEISEPRDTNHRPFREGFHSRHENTMHACGHDGHAAIGLGVAHILTQIKDRLSGTVRLIFQPGEEGSRGAKPMVDAGVAQGVRWILGTHIGFQAKKPGQLICGTGNFLATTKFDVSFSGVAAHSGAAPNEGRNAVLAGANAILNLYAISRHAGGASRINVGKVSGGHSRNIVPSSFFMQAETRGQTTEINDYLFSRAQCIVESAAIMHDVDWNLKLMGSAGSGQSSQKMIQFIRNIAEGMDVFRKGEIIDYCDFGGTDDFSHFLTAVQNQGGSGTYIMLGTTLASGHHNERFDFDESVLLTGTELLVRSVSTLLSKAI